MHSSDTFRILFIQLYKGGGGGSSGGRVGSSGGSGGGVSVMTASDLVIEYTLQPSNVFLFCLLPKREEALQWRHCLYGSGNNWLFGRHEAVHWKGSPVCHGGRVAGKKGSQTIILEALKAKMSEEEMKNHINMFSPRGHVESVKPRCQASMSSLSWRLMPRSMNSIPMVIWHSCLPTIERTK